MIGRDETKVGLRSCQTCMLRLRSSWMWYRVVQWHPISGRDTSQGRVVVWRWVTRGFTENSMIMKKIKICI